MRRRYSFIVYQTYVKRRNIPKKNSGAVRISFAKIEYFCAPKFERIIMKVFYVAPQVEQVEFDTEFCIAASSYGISSCSVEDGEVSLENEW